MTRESAYRGAGVRPVLEQACQEHELLLLVTPYLHFESAFLALEPDAVQVRATMTAEEATYGLRSEDLRFRFPHAGRFLEARTRLLGFGLLEGRRTLRLALPAELRDEDQRAAYRVERVGRVEVTYSTPRFQLRSALLVNLSTSGVRLSDVREAVEGLLQPGDLLNVSIPLAEGLRIDSPARVAWVQGRALGVAFQPALTDPCLAALSRWVFLKREEERDRIPARAPLPVAVPGGCAPGILLVSGSAALEEELRAQLAELPELRRVEPTAQDLKDAVARGALMVLFHLQATGLDARKRLRSLLETLPPRLPVMLLGTGAVDGVALTSLGQELKVAFSYVLPERPSTFFPRLVQGILRRFAEGSAS